MVSGTLALTGVTLYQAPDGALDLARNGMLGPTENANFVDSRHTYGCRMVRVDILNFTYRSLLLKHIFIEINDVKYRTGQLDQE